MTYVFDLDGTICFNGRSLSHSVTQSLHALLNKGHRIIFASARSVRDMLPVLPEAFHHLELIGANGVLISQNKKVKSIAQFRPEQKQNLLSLMAHYQVQGLIDGVWHYHFWQDKHHPLFDFVDVNRLARHKDLNDLGSWTKALILSANNLDALQQELQQHNFNVYFHQTEGALDISPDQTNKFLALQNLDNPVSAQNYTAFGNDNNDLMLLKHAHTRYQVGEHPVLDGISHHKLADQNMIEETLYRLSKH